MDRLTEYEVVAGHVHAVPIGDAEYAIQRLAAYEDTGLEPEEIIDRLAKAKVAGIFEAETQKALDKLMEYHKAESDGRLIVLPPKDKQTNADGIRAMSDEELAAHMLEVNETCPPGQSWDECPKDYDKKITCRWCWLNYLRLPAEGGEQDATD